MAIDCRQFEEIVHELERPGTAGFVMRQQALAHAESCVGCGALLDKVMVLGYALDRLAVEGSEQVPTAIETALVAEFRRRHTEAARQPRQMRLMAALTMAAALVLALGISAPYWLSHAARSPNAGVTKQPSPESFASAQGAEARENSTLSDSDYATNFVSLPYADDPDTLEGGTVVRVTLSRAALASFGVPVAGMNATDQIPADIALSEDGVPQAIRLVADADLDVSGRLSGSEPNSGSNSQ